MKINRSFLLYSFIISILLSLILLVLYKYSPLTFTHTLYYCQQSLWAISISSYYIIIAIFLFSLICAVFTLVKTFIFQLRLKTTNVLPTALYEVVQEANLNGKIKLISSEKPMVFCLGLLNPSIYISEGLVSLMTQKELTAIILHEKNHLLERDNIKILAATFLKDVLLFFPFIGERVQRFILNKELAADRMAVQYLKNSKGLLSAFEKLLSYENSQLRYVSYFVNPDSLEYRIENLTNTSIKYPMYSIRSLSVSGISFIIFFLLLISPFKKTEVHAYQKDVVLICNADNGIKTFSSQLFSSAPIKLYSSKPL